MSKVFEFNTALLRQPGQSVIRGLRANDSADPKFEAVNIEHTAYAAALDEAGLKTIVLPPLEEFPDSLFVEDPALVFSQGAIVLRPGAKTRSGEVDSLAPTLRGLFDTVLETHGSGNVEGGDILVTAQKVMIGLSDRTNEVGARELQILLTSLGQTSEIVHTPDDVLHFKSDCSLLDEETILSTSRLARSGVFADYDVITVPHGEEAAANSLRVNDVVMVGAQHQHTLELLDRRGYKVVPLKTEEIAKIDAGLSCMSLRW